MEAHPTIPLQTIQIPPIGKTEQPKTPTKKTRKTSFAHRHPLVCETIIVRISPRVPKADHDIDHRRTRLTDRNISRGRTYIGNCMRNLCRRTKNKIGVRKPWSRFAVGKRQTGTKMGRYCRSRDIILQHYGLNRKDIVDKILRPIQSKVSHERDPRKWRHINEDPRSGKTEIEMEQSTCLENQFIVPTRTLRSITCSERQPKDRRVEIPTRSMGKQNFHTIRTEIIWIVGETESHTIVVHETRDRSRSMGRKKQGRATKHE